MIDIVSIIILVAAIRMTAAEDEEVADFYFHLFCLATITLAILTIIGGKL